MSPLGFSFNPSKEQDLIISIGSGSGSVYGAIVEFEKNQPPYILFVHETKFPIKKSVTADSLTSHMLGSLHTVVSELGKKHKKKIRTVHVVFASPWFSSFAKPLSIKKDELFTVSEKTIGKMTTEYITKIAEYAALTKSVIIEKTLSDIKINGYEIQEPYGKEANELDLSVYVSTAPEEINKKIESEIYSVIHPDSIRFHTFPFAAQSVTRTLFSPKDDFALVDIGSEITDVLIIRRGSIHSIASFPLGSNHIARNVATHFETEPELASSMLGLYSKDVAEEDVRQKISNLVDAFAEEWGMEFSRSVNGGGDELVGHFTPQRAYFASNPETVKILSDIISKQIPNVVPLSRESLSQFVRYDGNEPPNVFMILEAIYLSTHPHDSSAVYKTTKK